MGSGTLAQLLDVFEWLSGYCCILLIAHFVPRPGLSVGIISLFQLSAWRFFFFFWHFSVTLVTPETVILLAVQEPTLTN